MSAPDFTRLTSENITDAEWEELLLYLDDPIWRLTNLYKIKKAETGQLGDFVPTPEQCEVINAIHLEGCTRLLIIKARQLGMSTVIDLILADMAIWNEGFQGSIVDQTQADASIKLTYKVVEAFNSMPQLLRDSFEIRKCNSEEFSVSGGDNDEQVSVVFAGKNARGGTNQFLHISEWGPIQHEDPARSDDIMNGAIPSAESGIIVIETTWMGGKFGNLWGITKAAMETRKEDMTSKDYRLFFFPWFTDKRYAIEGNYDQIPITIHAYFETIERQLAFEGRPHRFTPQQKLWYFKVCMPKGSARFAEYPTVMAECFLAPVPGAIYSKLVDTARANGRITTFSPRWSREHPVFTFWDLGSPINTRTIYVQFIGREIHIIDHDWQLPHEPVERVAHMNAKGYFYGGHFLPHDAESQEKSGKNFRQQLNEAGLEGLRVIPRCKTVWPGINKVAEIFERLVFSKDQTEHLVSSLEIYRTKQSRVDGMQTNLIVEDDSCHDADTLRMLAEAIMNGMLKGYGSASNTQTVKDVIQSKNTRQRMASRGRSRRP